SESDLTSTPSGVTETAHNAGQFALEQLRMNPEISFADLRDRGRLQGVEIHPLTYYRSKETLGLVPKRQRGRRRRDASDEHAPEPMGSPRPPRSEVPRRGRRLGPTMVFLLDYLRTHPDASFREVEQAARAAGHAVAASVFSRAKARLGLGRRRRS